MAIMRVKDKDGNVQEILVIRGEDYVLTEQDKEEIASMISDSDGNGNFSAIAAHKNDTSNPHGVTAEQIGAVTQEELQDALDSFEIPAGADGVSVTHSWDGTVLTITSASGTSSADLKGEKGDPGEDGQNGSPGADGYTPVLGVDYWTESDRTQMVAAVIAALPVYNGEVD